MHDARRQQPTAAVMLAAPISGSRGPIHPLHSTVLHSPADLASPETSKPQTAATHISRETHLARMPSSLCQQIVTEVEPPGLQSDKLSQRGHQQLCSGGRHFGYHARRGMQKNPSRRKACRKAQAVRLSFRDLQPQRTRQAPPPFCANVSKTLHVLGTACTMYTGIAGCPPKHRPLLVSCRPPAGRRLCPPQAECLETALTAGTAALPQARPGCCAPWHWRRL